MIIGVDIDGVLADFNNAYASRLAEVTGRRLAPQFGVLTQPPCWDWEESYGYSKEDAKKAWKSIEGDRKFWVSLAPFSSTLGFLLDLDHIRSGHEIYFVTSRVGINLQEQTKQWLHWNGFPHAHVLIARGEKGFLTRGLGIDHFIDDRPENCISIKEHSPECEVMLLRRTYNEWFLLEAERLGVKVIDHVSEFMEVLHAARP